MDRHDGHGSPSLGPLDLTQKTSQNIAALSSGSGQTTIGIHGGTFNFHAGDRGNTGTSRAALFRQSGPSLDDDCASEFVKEFHDAYEQFRHNEVQENIGGNFRGLNNPKKEVLPQLIETDYFGGDTAAKEGLLEADPTYLNNNYSNIKGNKVDFKKIHENCRYAAIIAQAGAGKTTLAKRYSSAVKAKQISSLKEVEMVCFIPLASVWNKPGTVMEVLFHRLLPNISEGAKIYGELWVKQNSEKILFVFDGLDQVEWSLERCSQINFTDSALPSQILYNLLHKNLLPESKILLTSREFAVRHLTRDTRPEKVLTTKGLSEKDMKTLITQLAPTKAERIIETVFKKSPAIRSLGTNPMFLIFTTAILAKDSEEDTPDSLSGILMRLLKYFLLSENQRVPNIRDIIENLCSLALEGMKKRKFVFSEKDMDLHELDPKLVQDLVIITPQAGIEYFYKLIEGCFRMFFCHQSVQEALAAIKIKGKLNKEFMKFVDEELHKDHWEVVLRNLVGITFNHGTIADAEVLSKSVRDEPEKKAFMTEWFEKLIDTTLKKYPRLQSKRVRLYFGVPNLKAENLCALLHECGDSVKDIISKKISRINVSQRVRIDQAYAVLWVLSHCQPGVEFDLRSGYSDYLKDMLVSALKKCIKANIDFRQFQISLTRTYNRDQIRQIKWTPKSNSDSPAILTETIQDSCIDFAFINLDGFSSLTIDEVRWWRNVKYLQVLQIVLSDKQVSTDKWHRSILEKIRKPHPETIIQNIFRHQMKVNFSVNWLKWHQTVEDLQIREISLKTQKPNDDLHKILSNILQDTNVENADITLRCGSSLSVCHVRWWQNVKNLKITEISLTIKSSNDDMYEFLTKILQKYSAEKIHIKHEHDSLKSVSEIRKWLKVEHLQIDVDGCSLTILRTQDSSRKSCRYLINFFETDETVLHTQDTSQQSSGNLIQQMSLKTQEPNDDFHEILSNILRDADIENADITLQRGSNLSVHHVGWWQRVKNLKLDATIKASNNDTYKILSEIFNKSSAEKIVIKHEHDCVTSINEIAKWKKVENLELQLTTRVSNEGMWEILSEIFLESPPDNVVIKHEYDSFAYTREIWKWHKVKYLEIQVRSEHSSVQLKRTPETDRYFSKYLIHEVELNVRESDPDLFKILPKVLRDASTEKFVISLPRNVTLDVQMIDKSLQVNNFQVEDLTIFKFPDFLVLKSLGKLVKQWMVKRLRLDKSVLLMSRTLSTEEISAIRKGCGGHQVEIIDGSRRRLRKPAIKIFAIDDVTK